MVDALSKLDFIFQAAIENKRLLCVTLWRYFQRCSEISVYNCGLKNVWIALYKDNLEFCILTNEKRKKEKKTKLEESGEKQEDFTEITQ